MNNSNGNEGRIGHNAPPDIDTQGANEQEWRQTAEQVRAQHDEETRPGGGGPGMYSEGREKSAKARTMKRLHHSGRVRDEFGGVRGRTK